MLDRADSRLGPCPAYLGDAYSPFVVSGNPNLPNFTVPNIGLTDANEVRRLGRRSSLRQNLDTLERAFDQQRELAALKLQGIDRRLADLKAMRKGLTLLLRECEIGSATGACPIFDALAAD